MNQPQDRQQDHDPEQGQLEQQEQLASESEPQQRLNIYEEEDVPFRDLSQSSVRHCLYIGIGIFTFALIASFVITVPREINLPFEFRGGLREVIYQYPEKTYLLQAHVNTGDAVAHGAPLVTITSEKIVSLIQAIDESRKELNLYKEFRRAANQKEIELMEIKKGGIEDRLQLAEKEAQLRARVAAEELRNLRQQVDSRRKQFQRNQSLHARAVLSDQALEQSQIALLEAEQLYLLTDREQYEEGMAIANRQVLLKNELALLEAQLENAVTNDKLQAAQTRQQYDLALQRLHLNYGPSDIAANSLILKSPVDGTVSMRIENESEIAPQEYLLRLQAGAGEPYAYAKSPSASIGQVEKGGRAVLKYDAFPHYYYGTMTARVDTVSTSPSAQGDYPIRMTITELNRLEGKVINGMRGVASITVEEKPIIRYMLRSFLKHTTVE